MRPLTRSRLAQAMPRSGSPLACHSVGLSQRSVMPSSAHSGSNAAKRARELASSSASWAPGNRLTCSMPTWKWQRLNQACGTVGASL